MKIDSVKYKTFKGNSWRFDPSFHLSEANKVFKTLKRSPYTLTDINNCSERVFLGNIFSRVFVKDSSHGIPYLAASDTVLSNIDTGTFLSKKQADALSYLKLEKDWILVTCSGTVGNVTYTNKCFENHIATHDLIRIVPNDNVLKRGVVYAYLSSKYGHLLLTQSKFGGVVKHINDDHVKNIPIPQFPVKFQEKVDDLIKESARFREEAAKNLDKAMSLLSEFVGIDAARTGFKVTCLSSQKFKESLHMRLDPPPYIYDSVDKIKYLVSKKRFKRICDINAEISYPGIFKRIYVKNGFPYIMGSALMDRNPFKTCDYLSKTRTPKIDQLLLKKNQILITCAGCCGDVKIITDEFVQKNAIGSPDIIRIMSKDSLYTPEYLFAYLRLPLIREYMQSMKYGSVIERFDAEHIGTIPVVEPSPKIKSDVTSMVRKYANAMYESFCKEEIAVQLIEKEIDGWNA